MKHRLCLVGIMVLLLAACGGGPDEPGDAGPAADESTTSPDVDAESAEQDTGGQDDPDPQADETQEATPEDQGTEAEATDTDTDADGGEGAGADRLAVALDSVAETMGDDGVDDHCEPLSAWTEVEATLAGLLEDGSRQDGSLEARGGELVQFGCGFGWHSEGEGFGSLAVLVSVYATPAELPPDFQEVSTPAGMSAHSGQGELEDDLVWMNGGPVSAAVTVVGEHELRVTALPDTLEPQELLAVLDAAWEDLG